MKKLNILTILVASLFLMHRNASGWSNDILIHPFMPPASHSMAAKSNGMLYLCVPFDSGNGTFAINIHTSSDHGDTWTPLIMPNAVSTSPILKTKMVVTSTDSIFCLYLSGQVIYVLNLESGILGIFNIIPVDDFDAAASPNGNVIYLFTDESSNNSIKRYGTLDGGVTWTGNTATVTSNGARPSVYMTGTRLVLNYYGPVLPDTASSVIRTAFYDEGVPGTITPGTGAFQDLVTNTSVRKKQFKSVIQSGIVWFFFTEGDAQQVIKCRISSDNGATYAPEFVLSGTAAVNSFLFDAAHYSNASGSGCYLTFFADSILFPPPLDPMVIISAAFSSPALFTPAVTYSDHTVISTPSYFLPVLVPFMNAGAQDVGVAWVEDAGFQPMVYFDRMLTPTFISEATATALQCEMVPNPLRFKTRIYFSLALSNVRFSVYDATGRNVLQPSASEIPGANAGFELDLSTLRNGIYYLKSISPAGQCFKKFVKN